MRPDSLFNPLRFLRRRREKVHVQCTIYDSGLLLQNEIRVMHAIVSYDPRTRFPSSHKGPKCITNCYISTAILLETKPKHIDSFLKDFFLQKDYTFKMKTNYIFNR